MDKRLIQRLLLKSLAAIKMSETKMEKICTTKVQVVIKMALLHIKCYKKEILQECKKGGNG